MDFMDDDDDDDLYKYQSRSSHKAFLMYSGLAKHDLFNLPTFPAPSVCRQ